MTETNVFQLSQPGTFADPLTEVLRNGARALLAQAVEAEVAALLSAHADNLTDDGRQRLVRHGHLPGREIMTGIGPVAVRCPRVRDRVGEGSERIRFSSAILPPYARRSKSLEVLIPILYLKGVSTGDFEEALIALLGKDAGGLSATTVGRLKDAWSEEHVRWSKRDLSTKRYVYFYAEWRLARVSLDYHVEVDGFYYSVPHALIRAEVDLRITARTIELFHRGQRVAAHQRRWGGPRHGTDPDHMPSAHRRYAEWTPERFRRWAAKIGPNTEGLIVAVLAHRPHPEQGFRTCLGILRLYRGIDPARAEAVSARAVEIGALTYKSVASIITHKLDKKSPQGAGQSTLFDHQNLRGPRYFN